MTNQYFHSSLYSVTIVDKGGSYSPFLDQTPLFKDPPLSRNPRYSHPLYPIRKTKVLNGTYNQFVYHFYPQSILILEKNLQKL